MNFRLGPLKPIQRSDNAFRTEFTYRAVEGQQLEIIPKASSIVFTPELVELRAATDCQEQGAQFYGEKGVMIEGKINPPLEGVKVVLKVASPKSENTQITRADGRFGFGPLKKNAQFA